MCARRRDRVEEDTDLTKPERACVPTATLALLVYLALSIQAIPPRLAPPYESQSSPSASLASASPRLGTILDQGSRFALPRWGSGAVSPGDLNAALGATPRRLSLFRNETAVDGRRELLRRMPFGAILAAAGERNRIDSLLLAAVVETESRFAPRAVSSCGAVGLMQLLPSTAEDYGVKDLRDPYSNVDAGSRYLRTLLDRFRGRPDLALAAYNTGAEVVARYGCVPPYRETQDFVRRVLTRYDQHRTALVRASSSRPVEIRMAAGPSPSERPGRRSEGDAAAR